MNILVLNCGSSSLKFQLIATDHQRIADHKDTFQASGSIERIGSQSLITLTANGDQPQKLARPFRDHKSAIEFVLQWLVSDDSPVTAVTSLSHIQAVGHRVVHGGERFTHSALIDGKVLAGIEDCIALAPLHNPANLSGIYAIREILGPQSPQVAVFDTSFHAPMGEPAFLYAIPYQFYRRYKIRRYGFHGTSHRYIAYRYRQLTGRPKDQVNIITLHLGNGCSACAIQRGQSMATSMGMTPLEGLVMGTRSGDLDPAIIDFLGHQEGMNLDQLDAMLNKQSGLLGISGLTNDMRELLEEEAENGDRRATLAIEIFCQRVRKYIGAYLAEMNGTDAVIFAGGIGENAPAIRQRICQKLGWLGLELDEQLNQAATDGAEGVISRQGGRLTAMVIPTNEELLIARDTYRCVAGPD